MDQGWRARTGRGRACSARTNRAARRLYGVSARLNAAEVHELEALAWLRGLEDWRGPFGPAARVHLGAALQQSRYEPWETRMTLGVAFKRDEAL